MEEQKKAEYEVREGDFEGENAGREDEDLSFSFRGFCEEAVSLLLTAYLFILFCMYPFYMKSGYADIGNDKFLFFKAITIGGYGLILPLALICLCFRFRSRGKGAGMAGISRRWRFSLTDGAVIAYGISAMLSYFCSDFKEKGLWGEKGWNMGLLTQLAFVLSYLLLVYFWEYEEKLLLAVMAAASAVFLLGLLNRFSIYPIDMEADIGFLSTLGNINWYCGYWAVFFPVGFVFYWCEDKVWPRMFGLACAAVGIATGVSQGSNSAWLVFVGVYICVFCLSFRDVGRMKRFLELVMLFCIVCQGLRLWRILRPEAFNFYSGTLSDWITLSRVTLLGLVLAGFLYLLLLCVASRRKSPDLKNYKAVRQIIVLVAVVAAGVYILLLILNSKLGGIRFMGNLSALVFNKQWGNARGATWAAGAEIFRNMQGWKKLTGVGPDCFAMYLYTLPDLAKSISRQFDGARLTNAHNEWLTVLVNQGILGLASYIGIFVSAFVRFIFCGEKASEKKYLYIYGISVFAYTIHNIVSFQQILSTPFVFLMLGMGEALLNSGDEAAASQQVASQVTNDK